MAGERVRLVPGGDWYVVSRVSVTAAYLHKVYDPPVLRTFEDPKTGEQRTIHVSRGPIEPGISAHAFVYREKEERNDHV